MEDLKVLDEREILGKEFKMYGTIENPLFLAKSVAEWIEHTDLSRMVNLVDDDEKLKRTLYVSGQNRNMWFLTEDGLYEVLMQSRKPIAKAFKKEVKQILKQIRMTVKTLENTTFQGNIDNLVISKDGIPMTNSRIISEVTGKEHFHILRDIREEIDKLKEIHNPNLDSELIINDFKETTYLAENGQTYTQYELGEMATMQLMLKYSTEYRAKFIIAFQKMKTAMLNMFKSKVLDDVLPQNNRLRQYIYVIKNPLNETVKIGVAQDVDKRIK